MDSAEVTPTSPGDRSEWPEVAVVVLNWNNYEDTAECLESLSAVEYPNFDVIVVDNGSSDDSGSRLADDFPWAEVIFNNENEGFAAGNNVGIDAAMSHDADYVLLLNNDTIVEDDFLTPLIKTAESNEKTAIVGGTIYEAGSDDIWFAGADFIKPLVKSRHYTEVKQPTSYETDFVIGAMMLLSAGFLEEVGGLNEDYFFGHEDVDICIEARDRAWDVRISPNSRIEHKVSGSAGVHSPFWYYHATWNRLHFAKSRLKPHQRIIFYIFFVASRLIRLSQWAVTGESEKIGATKDAIRDYISSTEPEFNP